MIFATVGSMLPFDRLIRAMDSWVEQHPREEVFAQIGNGAYVPQHMQYQRMLAPTEFNRLMERAELLVAHAGTGTMIAAAGMAKPVVLLARLARRREHTTDHQVHTAQWLANRPGVFLAPTEAELGEKIAQARSLLDRGEALAATASESFIRKIRTVLVK